MKDIWKLKPVDIVWVKKVNEHHPEQVWMKTEIAGGESAGGITAEYYRAMGDGEWCSIVNQKGKRGFDGEESTRADAEQRIFDRIKTRIDQAKKWHGDYCIQSTEVAA